MGKKRDLSDRGMIAGVRLGGLSISETAGLLGSPEFAENGAKKTSNDQQFDGQTGVVNDCSKLTGKTVVRRGASLNRQHIKPLTG